MHSVVDRAGFVASLLGAREKSAAAGLLWVLECERNRDMRREMSCKMLEACTIAACLGGVALQDRYVYQHVIGSK